MDRRYASGAADSHRPEVQGSYLEAFSRVLVQMSSAPTRFVAK